MNIQNGYLMKKKDIKKEYKKIDVEICLKKINKNQKNILEKLEKKPSQSNRNVIISFFVYSVKDE